MLPHPIQLLPDSFPVLDTDSVLSAPLLNRLVERIAGEEETRTRRPQRHSEETVEGVEHHAPSVGGEVGIVFGLPRPVVGDDDVHGHKQTIPAFLRFLDRAAWGRGEGSNQHLVLVRPIRKSYRITEVMVQPLSKVAVKKYAAGDVFHVFLGFLSRVGQLFFLCWSVVLQCSSVVVHVFLSCLSVLVSCLSCVRQLSVTCFAVVFRPLSY